MTKKFNLKDVTLLAVSSVNIEHTQDALMISSYEIDFGSIKLLSPEKPNNIFKSIELILDNFQFLVVWSIWSSIGLIFFKQPLIISVALSLIIFFVIIFFELSNTSLRSS